MYVVAGATGRVGSAVADRLLQAGEDVRVLVRRNEAAQEWADKGALTEITTLEDSDRLTQALEGCDGFFVLVPTDPTVEDPEAHAADIIRSISTAITTAQVPHVVMLSSVGADLDAGTGPILGLHYFEQALRATGAKTTALRPGHFQEKVAELFGAASEGVYPVFASTADRPIPMVATRDIGAAAADALRNPPAQSEVVDVVGPEYSEADVARALGEAMGRPLELTVIPRQAWAGALVESGLPADLAASIAELYAADDDGILVPRGDRSVRATTDIRDTIIGLLESQAVSNTDA